MDKVAFPYRSSSHLVLLHVVAESGAWERHGLDVDYDRHISSTEAHRAVPAGDVEFVGGNHVSTYAHRARGDSWVYLGQTVNQVNHQLVVRADSGINGLADLHGKKVGTRGSHPSLNDWIYLKQHGLDVDREDIDLINTTKLRKNSMDAVDADQKDKAPPLWHLVRDGTIDATLLGPPANLFAKAAGLKVIDIDPLPMIQFTTVSSSLEFVEKRPDIVERFLKGLIEGIHYFKTRPEESIKIIQQRCTKHGQMNLEQATITHQSLAGILEPKLYPKMQAIANVYEEAIRQDKDAKKVNPMALWDLHHLRRLDDMGFVDTLYGKRNTSAHDHHGHDHDHDHAAHGKVADKVTASDAVPHLDCGDECAPTS
ncbi:MAG: taurine transport system substrate-binding protein [Alphaproteobacteria bacterium]|nr:taurine transport system substrate-binding protein [Alphaproteobacteria bacterium]